MIGVLFFIFVGMKKDTLFLSWSIDMDQKTDLYMRVFWEAPWNEWFVCPHSGSLYPLSSALSLCTCCDRPEMLRSFYSKDELSALFRDLTNRPWYQQDIASMGARPVGFMWGWSTNFERINIEKLWLSSSDIQSLQQDIQELIPWFNFDQFYYFAEIGIDAAYRGCDIASNLYRSQIQRVLDGGVCDVLVRTTRKTDLPYQWFIKMGYIPVYEYNDQQDRVLLIKRYS